MNKKTVSKVIGAVVAAGVLLTGVVCLAMSVERIPAGHVGVVYSMHGGVEDEVLQQGWHLVAPTKKVQEFTVGNE